MDKNTIKYIRSLHQKKYRHQDNTFLAEGVKLVNEAINSGFKIKSIYTTHPDEINNPSTQTIEAVTLKELGRISTLKNPNKALAIVEIPEKKSIPGDISRKLSLILENIQDPGNMGTIIRLSNWYGIENIFCNTETVECYNPKVVQSSMGALFRVKIHYTDIYQLLVKATKWKDFGIYATHLKGENIYNTELKTNGFILMGNESQGLSAKIISNNVQKIKLPSYPPEDTKMESLNVAMATAIIVAEFRRRMLNQALPKNH